MGLEAVPWLLTQGQALALALGVYFLTYLEDKFSKLYGL